MSDIFKQGLQRMKDGEAEAEFSFEPQRKLAFGDYTTYFANVRNLPKGVVPISICGKAPDAWKGLEYRKLAPKWWFFKEWKENHDNEFYVRNYNAEVLDKLNPDDVWNDLRDMSKDASFALVCYEKPDDFCHRHLVSEWLRKYGYEIEEFKG